MLFVDIRRFGLWLRLQFGRLLIRFRNIEITGNRIKPARGAAVSRKLATENNHKNAYVIPRVPKVPTHKFYDNQLKIRHTV